MELKIIKKGELFSQNKKMIDDFLSNIQNIKTSKNIFFLFSFLHFRDFGNKMATDYV
jgi:hypothetical protein